MGAWGIGAFENDDALDWLYDLEKVSDLSVIESALNEVESEFIEAPEGCNILAATEIVLALIGKARDGLPENAAEWVSKNSSLDALSLKPKVLQAIEVILSENSELKELWEESEDYEAWKSDIQEIKAVLS